MTAPHNKGGKSVNENRCFECGNEPHECRCGIPMTSKGPIGMTPSQIELLRWLARDVGQYGECKGKDLDALMAAGLVEWSRFSRADQPNTTIDYRWVAITDEGIAALRAANPEKAG